MPNPQKVVVTLNHKSLLAQDATLLTMYFDRGTAPSATDYDNLRDDISDFFNVAGSGAVGAIAGWLASTISTTTNIHTIRWYNIPATRGPLGSPVATRTFQIASPGPSALPAELAVCLSYQRAYGTDVEFGASGIRPRGRDRGRMYIGPLSSGAAATDTTTKEVYVSATLADDFTRAAKSFLGVAALADSWTWLQFSETEWTWDAVTNTWVDNAFDIQRRRGVKATSKVSLAL